jgi:hypothetical protein
MCNANLLMAGSLAASTAGALTSTFGAYGQSKAQKASLEYQASVDRNNAQLMEWEAQDAIARGESAWQKHRLDTAGLKGTQRAVMSSRGIDLGEGTPARILTDTDFLSALDGAAIRRNAGREAWTARARGAQYTSDADAAQYGADNTHPALAATGTLLNGVSTVASQWYQFKAIS